MIKHQQQLTDTSCVAACLAMISGVDQQVIIDAMKSDGNGTSLWYEFRQWVRLGYLPYQVPWTRLKPGKVVLATVPSLNIVGGNHRIIIDLSDEHCVYDPNEGRLGVKAYTLDILKGWTELTEVHCCRLPNILEKAKHALENSKPYAMSDTGSQVDSNMG